MTQFRGTTICAVQKNGKTAIAGDGQVTLGSQIIKSGARKVRPLLGGKVLGRHFGHWAEIAGGLILVGIGVTLLF